MFKSKRSGLVRRLWRSRLVTESDGRDGGRRGEGGRHGPCGRHPGKLHSREQRSVTHTDPAPGLAGEAGDPTESAEREEEEQPDDDRGAMCVTEHRGSRRGQEGDGRTVTCCLFGDWDLRPRSPYWAPRKDGGGPCQCAPRHAGPEEELASAAHAFLKRLKERSLDALAKAVETKGGITSECVMVPGTELRLGAHHVSQQYLLCKMYRWSDLPLSARLKALCHCQSFGAADSAKVCCNPYHYSRVCGPGKDSNNAGVWVGVCVGGGLHPENTLINLQMIRCMSSNWRKAVNMPVLSFCPSHEASLKRNSHTSSWGPLWLPQEPLEVRWRALQRLNLQQVK